MKKKVFEKCTIQYLDNKFPKSIVIWVSLEDKPVLEKILNLKLKENVTN